MSVNKQTVPTNKNFRIGMIRRTNNDKAPKLLTSSSKLWILLAIL